MAVYPCPEGEGCGPVMSEGADHAVRSEALLVPVVRGGEKGWRVGMGVKLGNGVPCRGVHQGCRRGGLLGQDQLVGVTVPPDGGEGLQMYVEEEGCQYLFEEVGWYEPVGEFELRSGGG